MNIRDFVLTAERGQAHALVCLLNQTHDLAGGNVWCQLSRNLDSLRVPFGTVHDLRREAIAAWEERRINDFAFAEHVAKHTAGESK